MEWRDTGILLAVRPHGETSAIVDVFTPERGRHAGVVRGGASRKMAPMLQPGAQLDLVWRARLEDQLGSFQAELMRSRSAVVMASRLALAGLNTVTALLRYALPEREAHLPLYRRSEALLDLLGQDELWPLAYLKWELALLQELGFGLDLSCCAVTGARTGLAYVSPKTGRAVTREGAGDWAQKLLPLPPVLLGHGAGGDEDVMAGLRLTGYFLGTRLAPELGQKPLPDARARFMTAFERRLALP
ncbi:DNA repair protein RecO [uncultured Lentibacter sp.]|jgi:DNA repair protein RecO (recombination protein O)|uniref:DNA repair protein RecO n=1 Tax=uncultured Lentibacter sp. TaxID=1659309 RepID=UPI0026246523|nr:DNA repair protein RecO [uncultured Lentibacter sp.]